MSEARHPDESPAVKVNSIRGENGEREPRAEMERALVLHAAASRILWIHVPNEKELVGVEG